MGADSPMFANTAAPLGPSLLRRRFLVPVPGGLAVDWRGVLEFEAKALEVRRILARLRRAPPAGAD